MAVKMNRLPPVPRIMTDDSTSADSTTAIEPGVAVYDDDGNELGVITGLTGEGFEVAIDEDFEHTDEGGRTQDAETPSASEQVGDSTDVAEESSEQEHEPGQEFGEGYLMWRCEECGEMGDLDDGLPEACPNCGSEDVIKWRED